MTMEVSYQRQRGLVPEELRSEKIDVIGAGTTGSWTVLSLVKMGFQNVVVVDDDEVEPHNYPAQFLKRDGVLTRWRQDDHDGLLTFTHHPNDPPRWRALSTPKVWALRKLVRKVAPREAYIGRNPLRISTRRVGDKGSRYPRNGARVFLCVDNVETRKWVAESKKAAEIVDMRMGALSGTVIFVPTMSPEDYLKTLEVTFVPEPECGPQALLTTALGLVGNSMSLWLAKERGEKVAPRYRWDFQKGMAFEEFD